MIPIRVTGSFVCAGVVWVVVQVVLYTTVGGVVTEVFTGPWEVGVRAPLLPSRYGRTGARLEVMLLIYIC